MSGDQRIMDNENRLLREKEVRELLGVSQSTLYRWCKSGRFIPSVHYKNARIKGWIAGDVYGWMKDNQCGARDDDQ